MREISSKLTNLYKFLIPAIPLVVLLIVFMQINAMKINISVRNLVLFGVVWAIIWAGVSFGIFLRLKRVWFDGEMFKVNIGGREIAFNTNDVEKVTAMKWNEIYPITLHMKNDIGFGKKLLFMPQYKMWVVFRGHETFQELDAKINHRLR